MTLEEENVMPILSSGTTEFKVLGSVNYHKTKNMEKYQHNKFGTHTSLE